MFAGLRLPQSKVPTSLSELPLLPFVWRFCWIKNIQSRKICSGTSIWRQICQGSARSSSVGTLGFSQQSRSLHATPLSLLNYSPAPSHPKLETALNTMHLPSSAAIDGRGSRSPASSRAPCTHSHPRPRIGVRAAFSGCPAVRRRTRSAFSSGQRLTPGGRARCRRSLIHSVTVRAASEQVPGQHGETELRASQRSPIVLSTC